MPPVLVLGCVAALALTASSPTATTGTAKRKEADRVSERGRTAEKATPQAREGADAGDGDRKVICTMRIMRADPSIDRAMVVAIERPVDPGMVVPTRCAAE
jgi:type II secretory pathway pseudopilin PulG